SCVLVVIEGRAPALLDSCRETRPRSLRERSAMNETAATRQSASAGATYRSVRGARSAASQPREVFDSRAGVVAAAATARFSNSASTPAARGLDVHATRAKVVNR